MTSQGSGSDQGCLVVLEKLVNNQFLSRLTSAFELLLWPWLSLGAGVCLGVWLLRACREPPQGWLTPPSLPRPREVSSFP